MQIRWSTSPWKKSCTGTQKFFLFVKENPVFWRPPKSKWENGVSIGSRGRPEAVLTQYQSICIYRVRKVNRRLTLSMGYGQLVGRHATWIPHTRACIRGVPGQSFGAAQQSPYGLLKTTINTLPKKTFVNYYCCTIIVILFNQTTSHLWMKLIQMVATKSST